MAELLIPNLMKVGTPRKTKPEADLITIWNTPYPVIGKYKVLCNETNLKIFAGGTIEKQGPNYVPGFITSGYRDEIIEGNESSPHPFAIALDIAIGSDIRCLDVAKKAERIYSRIGLYPGHGFIHVDEAPDSWIEHYKKKRYWVKVESIYYSYDKFEEAIERFYKAIRKEGNQ